jgi:hypothetical protein
MSYQAVVRNNSNALVQNSLVGIKISILDQSVTGPALYIETHTKQTNQNGLLDLQIGGGTLVSGVFNNGLLGPGIYWGQPRFLKTEIDPLGGTNYTITSTSELLSVPVSNYAHVSGSLEGQSWKFVGAYNQVNQASTDFLIEGYSFINYLGFDKVTWTWKIPSVDNNLNGTLDVGEIGFEHTLYGTVFDNVVTFPPQIIQGETFPQMIGTLIGNNLIITYGSPDGEVLQLVKQ